MSQVNVSHLTFDNDSTIYNLEDETARAEIAALHVELTQAEYDALTPEEKNNGTEYFITDSTDSGDFSYFENRLSVLDGKTNTLNEIATLKVTDVKGVIHSSASPKYTFIKNKGENDCYISATDNVGEGIDGTILLQSNSTIMLENLSDVNYICKSGKTTVICVCFQNSVNDPFARDESIGSSGGNGGSTLGIEEVVLWENDGTTSPQTITLSEAWSDFDELVVYNGSGDKGISTNIYTKSVLSQNAIIGIIEDTERRVWYQFTSSTTLNKADEDTAKNIALHAIVGRRYTKVNPTGYREIELYSANAPHKNNVELSQAYTNFDEIVIIWKYSDMSSLSDYPVRYETTKLTSQMNTDDIIAIWEGNVLTNAYVIYDSTHLNFVMSNGTIYSYLAKIIGIKY